MIEIQNISYRFPHTDKVALRNVSLIIESGDFFVLLGHSGCGKTTLLKTLNRLTEIEEGAIFLNQENIQQIDHSSLRRKIGYVIQQGGLFSHLSVFDNIALVAQVDKIDKQLVKKRVEELLNLVSLPIELLDRFPDEISGGQQQRVGIARALMNKPDIILMDEPFSALDPLTREALQVEVKTLQQKLGTTIVFVTHDIDEALKLATKICYMENGEVVQIATPEEIIKQPIDQRVRTFMGKNKIWQTPEFIRMEEIMQPLEHYQNFVFDDEQVGTFSKQLSPKTQRVMAVVKRDFSFVGVVATTALLRENSQVKSVYELGKRSIYNTTPQQTLMEMLKVFPTAKQKCIPVIDANNHLVGVANDTNVAWALSQQYAIHDDQRGGV